MKGALGSAQVHSIWVGQTRDTRQCRKPKEEAYMAQKQAKYCSMAHFNTDQRVV